MEPEHGTRLADGRQLADHDDWACVQDMAEAGIFADAEGTTLTLAAVEPGIALYLSRIGERLCSTLRAHKRTPDGRFGNFRPAAELYRQTDAT